MIHDKTDEDNWTGNVENWDYEFRHNDVVVAKDAQKRLGDRTYVVSQIDLDNQEEHVHQKGLFWEKSLAEVFATMIHA